MYDIFNGMLYIASQFSLKEEMPPISLILQHKWPLNFPSHNILLWVSFSPAADEIAVIAGFPLFGPPWENASCCYYCYCYVDPCTNEDPHFN